MPTPQEPKPEVALEGEALRQRLKKAPSFEPLERPAARQTPNTQLPPGWSSLENAIAKLEVAVTVAGAVFMGATTGALMVWAGANFFPGVFVTSIGGALVGFSFLRVVLKRY